LGGQLSDQERELRQLPVEFARDDQPHKPHFPKNGLVKESDLFEIERLDMATEDRCSFLTAAECDATIPFLSPSYHQTPLRNHFPKRVSVPESWISSFLTLVRNIIQ
jgi:hypothetical protein